MSDAVDGCFEKDEDIDERSCLEPLSLREREEDGRGVMRERSGDGYEP